MKMIKRIATVKCDGWMTLDDDNGNACQGRRKKEEAMRGARERLNIISASGL